MTDGHIERNPQVWNEQAPSYAAGGEHAWASNEPTWGIFGVAESELGMLPAARLPVSTPGWRPRPRSCMGVVGGRREPA